MAFILDDTIVARASAAGDGWRAIVRISGAETRHCLEQLFATPLSEWSVDGPARCWSGELQLADQLLIPCQLFFWPNNRSYTQQPSAELHLIQSPPLVDAAIEKLCQTGARLARPGEFTMRAFLAGRLDLAQAEAVLGVIDAADRRSLDKSLTQLAGGLSEPLYELRSIIVDLLADVEAGLDFADEDIEFITKRQIADRLDSCLSTLGGVVGQIQSRDTSHALPTCVLVGRPNAGKSSLLNALCPVATALVSAEAGTTRDYVTGTLNVGGRDVAKIIDTAGWEADQGSSEDPARGLEEVEADAQRASVDQAERADLLLLCFDRHQPLSEQDWQWLDNTRDRRRLIIATKTDLPSAAELPALDVEVSAKERRGIVELRSAIADELAASAFAEAEIIAATALRCRRSLEDAMSSIQNAVRINAAEIGDELLSAELRGALDHLGQVVGVVYTEDLLDRVFQRFCVGK